MAKNHPQQIAIITQARMGATRLPGKPLKEVLGKPLIAYQLERMSRATKAGAMIVATTTNPADQQIVDFCQQKQVPVFCGSEDDVLSRYYEAASTFHVDVIVRICADCPLIDPEVIDLVIDAYLNLYPNYDYVSNTMERTFPRGMDVEVISFHSLEQAFFQAKQHREREHVTPYLYCHPEMFKLGSVVHEPNESHHRWTVDTQEDFQLISTILQTLYPKNPNFQMKDILEEFAIHPEWISINAHIQQKAL
jgi:spore coat polysaccharide biosynthesis protein SpsF